MHAGSDVAPPKGLNGLFSRAVKEVRIRKALRAIGGARTILDVGSGLCEIVDRLPDGAKYVGIERDRWMFERAVARFPQFRFLNADIEADRIDLTEKFERILLIAVWEHLHDPARFLDFAREWIAAGGALVLTTPSPLAHRIIDAGSALQLLSSSAAEEHERLWTIREITELASQKGWRVDRAQRFLFGLNQLVVLRPAGSMR